MCLATVGRHLPVHDDGPGPGDPAEAGEHALGEADLDIDIIDTRYCRYPGVVTWPASRVAHSPHRGPSRGSTAASSVPGTGGSAYLHSSL